jgi:hypothetical protein
MPELVIDRHCLRLTEVLGALAAHHPTVIDVDRSLDLSACRDASVALLGAPSPTLPGSTQMVRRLRERYPQIAMYLIAAAAATDLRVCRSGLWSGADAVLSLDGSSELRHLASLIGRRLTAPPPVRELRQASDLLSRPRLRILALYVLRNALSRHTLGAVAERFGVSLRWQFDCFMNAGVPSPGVFERLGRLMHRIELERRGVTDRRQLAERLGYSDVGQLRRDCGRLRHRLCLDPQAQGFACRFDSVRAFMLFGEDQ